MSNCKALNSTKIKNLELPFLQYHLKNIVIQGSTSDMDCFDNQ